MKKLLSLLLLSTLCLTACGVKGPLYLAAEQEQQKQSK